MAYDLEKYRDKREKVLGVRRRGLHFATLAAIVAFTIVAGLSVVVVPKSVAYFNTRHLDDAIYKLSDKEGAWSRKLIAEIQGIGGVKAVEADSNGTRLVITFDKSLSDTGRIAAFFQGKGVAAVLLNHVGHRQRLHTLQQENK